MSHSAASKKSRLTFGWLRVPSRFFLTVSLLLIYFAASIVSKIFTRDPRRAEKRQLTLNVFFTRPILAVMGVKIALGKLPARDQMSGSLVVSNHLSYLDILVYIATGLPLTFITSVEIKHTPVLGWITQTGGALFIERRASKRSRHQLAGEIAEIRSSLQAGRSIMLFPEATTGNGGQILPFKSAFLEALVSPEEPERHHEGKVRKDMPRRIQCFVIQYHKIGRQKISLANRDSLFWYGGMTFFPHFFKLLSLPSITVKVRSLSAVETTPFHDRKALSDFLQKKISAAFRTVN